MTNKFARIAAAALLCALVSLWRPPSAAAQSRYENVALARVVDADTVRVNAEIEPGLWRIAQPCRLLRVQAPERNSRSGKSAAAALAAFLAGRKLTVEVRGRDAFGRWLCEITAGADNVSDWLLTSGHAEPYR